jgi:hypothetical protein
MTMTSASSSHLGGTCHKDMIIPPFKIILESLCRAFHAEQDVCDIRYHMRNILSIK